MKTGKRGRRSNGILSIYSTFIMHGWITRYLRQVAGEGGVKAWFVQYIYPRCLAGRIPSKLIVLFYGFRYCYIGLNAMYGV